jgi:small-conductance mechanosensitive channel
VNTALDRRRWEYDLTVSNASDLDGLKAAMIETVRKVPGVLSDPAPEVFVMDLTAADSTSVKLRVLWWSSDPHQHQMLSSYDKVLTGLAAALDQARNNQKQERAA